MALAGTAYLWTQLQTQQAELARVETVPGEARELGIRLDGLRDQIDNLRAVDERGDDEVESLRQDLAGQRRQLDELPLRIGRLERALDEVPGVADKARSAWLLAEAEYYMRIANAQLSLARNPDIALRALELSDEKLRDIGDPGLTRVRAMLADEMTALRSLPRPDAEGIALRLASIGRSLGELPLSRQSPDAFGQDATAGEGETGLKRAWKVIKDAFLSLIRVKRTDEAIQTLRTAGEESLLLRSMETEISMARWSRSKT